MECSICGSDGATKKTQPWQLAEVTDYKRKVAHFTGFPSGETHTIQGWKIRGLEEISLCVCKKCSQSIVFSGKKKRLKEVLIHCACWFVLIGIVLSAPHWDDLNPAMQIIAIVTFMVSWCRVRFLWKALFGGTTGYVLHAALEKVVGKSVSHISYEGLPPEQGIFQVEPFYWKELAPEYRNTEQKTGWSKFHYLRTYFPNSEECTPEQGARFLEVNHLGTYLDKI